MPPSFATRRGSDLLLRFVRAEGSRRRSLPCAGTDPPRKGCGISFPRAPARFREASYWERYLYWRPGLDCAVIGGPDLAIDGCTSLMTLGARSTHILATVPVMLEGSE